MVIFIRAIPQSTQLEDLINFVSPALRGSFLSPFGKIIKVRILVLHDKRLNTYEYHGLVEIDSDKAGQRVIKKLNRKRLNDKSVVVKEYINRSWQNDRRINHAQIIDKLGKGMRSSDRRRGKDLEIIKDASDMFSSTKHNSRKLIYS